MKLFVAFALLVAVASAAVIRPTLVSGDIAQIQQIIEAIHSPSTNPATAAALEQMLHDLVGAENIVDAASPIAIGPAIVEAGDISVGPAIIELAPISVGPAIVGAGDISVGPAIIDFPLPDGGAVSAPVEVSPVVVGPVVDSAAGPVVQIIINVKAPSTAGVGPEPVQIVDSAVVGELPEAVQIVEEDSETIEIVDEIGEMVQIVNELPEPVIIIDELPKPVQIVDEAPETVEIINEIAEPVHVVDIPA